MLDNVTTALSKYALVYVGLTGDAFFIGARRARALTAAVEGASEGKYRRKFKTERKYTLSTFLIYTTHYLSAFSSFDPTYRRATNSNISLRVNDLSIRCTHALCPGSSSGCCTSRWRCNSSCWPILCWACQGYVSSLYYYSSGKAHDFEIASADTLYICYCIDKDTGLKRRNEVFAAVSLPRLSNLKIKP